MDQKKKLQKLTRMELLELLLEQTHENEQLREKLQKAEEVLADRHLRVTDAGDLAHAVLSVNGVMDAAQEAAKQYLDNIRYLQQETEEKCARMLREAEEEAKKIRYEAMLGDELAAELLQDEAPEDNEDTDEK